MIRTSSPAVFLALLGLVPSWEFARANCTSEARVVDRSGAPPDDRATKPARGTPSSPLVSLAWLVEHERDSNLVLIDARDAKAYSEGHIPGAVSLPYRSTYRTDAGHEADVAPVRVINELFSRAGIDGKKSVVIYGDEKDYRPAAVVFWVLEVHGHPAAAVLNGGLAEWVKCGRSLSTEEVRPAAAQFIAEFKPERLVDKLEVCRALADKSVVILDSRTADEYTGTSVKDGAKRAGHIPTAIHMDAKKLYVEQEGVCSIQDLDTLASVYADLKGKKIYTYCNTGRSAALNYLVLRALGADVAVYDGSWMEWSADENLPIRTGPEQGTPPGTRDGTPL